MKVNQDGRLILSLSDIAGSSSRIKIIANGDLPPPPPEPETSNLKPETPNRFALQQNYPNPSNPVTVICYSLSVNSYTTLRVYDVLGREVATLVDEVKEPGEYTVRWNAENVPSGVYFYRLQARPMYGEQAGEFVDTKKLILMK